MTWISKRSADEKVHKAISVVCAEVDEGTAAALVMGARVALHALGLRDDSNPHHVASLFAERFADLKDT